jgi:hypothetical protein
VVEVGAFDEGELFLSALMTSKKDDFKWEVVVVYGPTQHDKSKGFFWRSCLQKYKGVQSLWFLDVILI